MKKTLLFLLLFMAASLHLKADVGEDHIKIYQTNGNVVSVNMSELSGITHSKTDLRGRNHDDYVALVLSYKNGDEQKYLFSEIDSVVTVPVWETLRLGTGAVPSAKKGQRRIYFKGTYPPGENGSQTKFLWKENDGIYFRMADQDTTYQTNLQSMTDEEDYAWFENVRVRKKENPLVVYYPGQNAPAYNKVTFAREQIQADVNSTMHIDTSGDCATDTAEEVSTNVYRFYLNHHPAFFTFLLKSDRVPSVIMKSVTMETVEEPQQGSLAGTYTFDPHDGVKLETLEDDDKKDNKITLKTPFYTNKDNWLHTPRDYAHAQDSTAAYMVVPPLKWNNNSKVHFKMTFNVVDTLSRIDTVFVKTYSVSQLNPNTVYTLKVDVPDTLFSIVDLGLGDIKYAFRNVEAYFERGPVAFYGGAFAYGETNTKNTYVLGNSLNNYRGYAITAEFAEKKDENGDAPNQRWRGCWRLMQNLEAETLLKRCKTEWVEYNGVEGALITGPSGKRIFLPGNANCSNYWTIDRSKKISDFYWIDSSGGWHFYKIQSLGVQQYGDSVAYHNSTEFFQPGYSRGVLEYSNDIRSNTDFDGSLMLLRHVGEKEEDGENFSINGIVRSARPWPTEGTNVVLPETGFIFGTDSATLYYNPEQDLVWADTLFIKGEDEATLNFRPVDGKHLKLVAGSKTVPAYADKEQKIKVTLSGQNFLGYLDKNQKYYVREYFRVYNPVTKQDDYYYASKATQLKGFFPHTDRIGWRVGDTQAVLNGHVVGVSTEIPGKVGFIIREYAPTFDSEGDEIDKADSIYHNLILDENCDLELADNGHPEDKEHLGDIQNNMTFTYTLNDLNPDKYYFVRAVFVSFTREGEVVTDTTCIYASETKILQPLKPVDLGLSVMWANIDLNGQFPEEHDDMTYWNHSADNVNELITDIGGTKHDAVFNDWYGREGWTYTMPTADQLQELLDNCSPTSSEIMTRFDREVIKYIGPNGNYIYMPYYVQGWYRHSPVWTSQRPWKDTSKAYYGGYYEDESAKNTKNITDKIWIRPVYQVSGVLDDGSSMFVSTDTVGMNVNHSEIDFWGRVLGVTQKMKDNVTVTRGFVLHDFKGGELKDVKAGNGYDIPDTLPETEKTEDDEENPDYGLYNGLFSVALPDEVKSEMDADKDYWYRAYIKVGEETLYGEPKKLSPLSITIDKIQWEVHENKAILIATIAGSVFIKDPGIGKVQVGFVVGDSTNIDRDTRETEWQYVFGETEVIGDGVYQVTMDVPKDTVYWVRAYIVADGKTRYSNARQFGLDYVDLGLPSGMLWANISVGAAYPEDDNDYYAVGEAFTKAHYSKETYIDDELKSVVLSDKGLPMYTTDSVMIKQLRCRSHSGNTVYEIPYRGAVHETYHCVEPQYWKHYSGTKNDAAYMNWENTNPLFTKDETKGNYIPNYLYGDLFVEPNYDEWVELSDPNNCQWTIDTENGVDGWRVTSKVNGNTIFLPFKGHRGSTLSLADGSWTDQTNNSVTAGYYHVADSVLMVSINTANSLWNKDSSRPSFDVPSDNDTWKLTWDEFYQGFSVRPIARWNLPLTKGADKVRNDTLAYLTTDTVTYLRYHTAVALQGTYRINYPLIDDKEGNKEYKLGFIVGERSDITYETATIRVDNVEVGTRNGSQYFAVLDKDDHLKGDTKYYYRFFLYTEKFKEKYGGDGYYYADADTFRLANHLTNHVEWRMYEDKAVVHGTVQGVMPDDNLSGFKAGFIISKNRNLTGNDDDLLVDTTIGDCSSQLSNHVGLIQMQYTLPEDATYYFRTFVYYNGIYHYGDVNLFGYELIDLGLPSGKKWANINVGGYNPNNGIYTYALSEQVGVTPDSQKNKPYATAGSGAYKDDAHINWHNVSRMPYNTEMKELIDYTTWEADTLFGCPGVRVKSKTNDNSIFLRHSIQYFQWQDDADYSLCGERSINGYYLDIDKTHARGTINSWSYDHNPGCRGVNFLRPIWESSHTLDSGDEILIRTDEAIIHDPVDNVTFFGSLLGITQQHMKKNGGKAYDISNVQYAGFIVGSDTLTTHDAYMVYDFPKEYVKSDTIFYYDTQNINLFKVDAEYWVRAYVKIDGNYYYGRSIKFVRQPNVITGDVEWKVGDTKAVLHGSVKGFNEEFILSGEDESENGELKAMEELSKNARVGIIVGYKTDVTHKMQEEDPAAFVESYDLGQAVNGEFQIEVPYAKDTTYYYRAFVKYNNKYVYAKQTYRYGLEFVDIGLPMQWASISVGSRFAEDKCAQFAWGDTLTNKDGYKFKFENYRYYNATTDNEYENLGDEIKGSVYDAAHVKWNYTWDEEEYGGRGALWAMPSEEDLQMLIDSCEWNDSVSYRYSKTGKDNREEVKGYKITGPNGKSIFLNKEKCEQYTISGYHDAYGPWEYGPLWTSSRAPHERNAYGMETGQTKDYNRLMKYHYRYHGHYIRPIAHINVTLPDKYHNKKLSITTERTSWISGAETATIYGCVLGLNELVKGSYGFVVGKTNDKAKLVKGGTDVDFYLCKEKTADVGLFSKTITPLDNNRMYYFRAFVEVDGTYYYGDVKEFGIVMVDLGLPSGTMWANVNMGSWKEKDHGSFYAWGETATKDVFTLGGYKYYNTLTGSYRELGSNISANDTTDVANKMLGGLWRMAGDEEWNELLTYEKLTWTPEIVSRVPGFRIKSEETGNSIFLPSNYFKEDERDANYDWETNEEKYAVNHDGEETHLGYYWTSNRAEDYRKARELQFDATGNTRSLPIAGNNRWRGNAIRPVASKNKGDFYIRTEGTDWRYQKDSVNFYSAVLHESGKLPEGYTAGFLIGTTEGVKKSTIVEGGLLTAKVSSAGSGDYVAKYDSRPAAFPWRDRVYYYRAFVTSDIEDEDKYLLGDAKQFGLVDVNMGTTINWANINVDAASPEEIGLNGIPSGKYAGVDPAYVDFGGLWRIPTEAEKQLLLDENKFEWTQNDDNGKKISLYGVPVWKVINKDTKEYIYLTSKNPAEWGYRAVTQSNVTFDDDKTIFLRTDSTNWRAGYTENSLYATLVGTSEVLKNIEERGFIVAKTDDLTKLKHGGIGDDGKAVQEYKATSLTTFASAYVAEMPELSIGTYHYRAYVKYGGKYYYADNALPVGIEFINLGLPSGTKWANVNIGSTVSTDLGDYYAWGELNVRDSYTTDTYTYYDSSKGYTDIGADISSSQYDVATQRIKGTRMPSRTELSELMNEEYCSWEAQYDVNENFIGYTVTSKMDGYTSNSIFLPYGNYWTASLVANNNYNASYLRENVDANTANVSFSSTDGARYLGMMVRPVTSLITTTDADKIDKSIATLNGIVGIDSYTGVTVGFEFSRNAEMKDKEDKIVDVSESGPIHYDLTDLAEGNIYYYRAFVKDTDSGEPIYGAIKSFNTLSTAAEKPEKVDLGLSVKWADRNIGAALPESNGNYYAWGDLETRQSYTAVTYTHYSNNEYHDIGTNISATEWDVVNSMLKGCWRMPTQQEMQELRDACTWTWSTKNGVPGYWVENKITHDKIFMPAAGYREITYLREREAVGRYWTATITFPTSNTSVAMRFNSTSRLTGSDSRFLGYTVRPVYQSNFTWDNDGEQRDIFIRTDSIAYAATHTQNTLYGTMLGWKSESDNLTQGFVIGTSSEVNSSTKLIDLHQSATANGAYSIVMEENDIKKLTVGDVYYVRAYVSDGTNISYGDPVELKDYTFFTDQVKWGLGNAGKLHGYVVGKQKEGVEVGFYYYVTTNENDKGDVDVTGRLKTTGKKMVASFGTGDDATIFTAVIDTIKVGTYYYQAYAKFEDGPEHYGAVKSFGAKAVNLGLTSGVQWIDMNLGSDNKEAAGNGYRWGETAPYDADTSGDYAVSSGFTFIGGTEYDAAHTRLGEGHRLPSPADIQELMNECDWNWDVNGFRVTSRKQKEKNGQFTSIFLPVGDYWSSLQSNGTTAQGNSTQAVSMKIDTTNYTPDNLSLRKEALLLRPIVSSKTDQMSGGGAGTGNNGGDDVEGNE